MIRHALPFFLLGASAAAQFLPTLEISELLLQPLPGDHTRIEVIAAQASLATAGFHLVIGTTSHALPAVTVPAGGAFVLHLGVSGPSSAHDLYLPAAQALTTSGSIALFRSAATNDPTQFLDYVAWGGATGPQAAMALAAGRWSALSDSCTVPTAAGATLANRRFTRSTGNLVGPLAWYHDGTPTLGAENDPAMTWAAGTGCVTPNAPGYGVNSSIDPGPWLGEPATIYVWPVTTFAVHALATSSITPAYLGPIGMPNCFAHLVPEVTFLLAAGSPYTTFVYTVPVQPQLVGFEFVMQAFVLDAAAGNPIGAQVTGAMRAHVGSR